MFNFLRFLYLNLRESNREGEREYAKRSMMGAQCLEAMRARRSRRALSTSFRYSVSTTGNAIEALLTLLTDSLLPERERDGWNGFWLLGIRKYELTERVNTAQSKERMSQDRTYGVRSDKTQKPRRLTQRNNLGRAILWEKLQCVSTCHHSNNLFGEKKLIECYVLCANTI